ncbi:MAG: hypothetical protein LBU81_07095 [Methanosarcinales archaeon]|jgi:hypothetical protein|nr:hypothetical protein [Methanosarcinales archaeon]
MLNIGAVVIFGTAGIFLIENMISMSENKKVTAMNFKKIYALYTGLFLLFLVCVVSFVIYFRLEILSPELIELAGYFGYFPALFLLYYYASVLPKKERKYAKKILWIALPLLAIIYYILWVKMNDFIGSNYQGAAFDLLMIWGKMLLFTASLFFFIHAVLRTDVFVGKIFKKQRMEFFNSASF